MIKLVPETTGQEQQIRTACEAFWLTADHQLLTKAQTESAAHRILVELGLPSSLLGWAMVVLFSESWRKPFAAVPFSKRMLLVPEISDDDTGLRELCQLATDLGYHVLAAKASSEVLERIFSGQVEAILGIATLDVLEKAIDKIQMVELPCLAIPAERADDGQLQFDASWARQWLNQAADCVNSHQGNRYWQVMQAAAGMFAPDQLGTLVRPDRKWDISGQSVGDVDQLLENTAAVASTEALAFDFLAKGGKYSRPFITLAVYDALTHGSSPSNSSLDVDLPDEVKRAAISIETFHKASLIHDDIEDDDQYRYGELTLHRRFGTPLAINVGDFMIGLGYRLVSRDAGALGTQVVAEILDILAEAHVRLSEGQGAELAWRESSGKRLTPADAIEIYALKTSPAFEAALLVGARLAGCIDGLRQPLRDFAKNLGIAFQILNDLKDWSEDTGNKLLQGGDVTGGRPTVLWALALEGLPPADRRSLQDLVGMEPPLDAELQIERVRRLYEKADVFEKSLQLVRQHRQQAEQIAAAFPADSLRMLLQYLTDCVLERTELPAANVSSPLPVGTV
ncbi:MAG: polyprenyl synthetase family protein [Planctomycetales bacterium]|nr:polyprenyl synthetase family protein [Planctomycetales bacterium]